MADNGSTINLKDFNVFIYSIKKENNSLVPYNVQMQRLESLTALPICPDDHAHSLYINSDGYVSIRAANYDSTFLASGTNSTLNLAHYHLTDTSHLYSIYTTQTAERTFLNNPKLSFHWTGAPQTIEVSHSGEVSLSGKLELQYIGPDGTKKTCGRWPTTITGITVEVLDEDGNNIG